MPDDKAKPPRPTASWPIFFTLVRSLPICSRHRRRLTLTERCSSLASSALAAFSSALMSPSCDRLHRSKLTDDSPPRA
jgi:hypothetical protein